MDEDLPDRFLSSIMPMEHCNIISPQAFKIRTRALLQVPAVYLQNRRRDIISKQTFRVCQISDQSGILGGAGWGDSSPDPHQLPSKRAQSYYLYYSLKQIIGTTTWRNNISLFLLLLDLLLAGDGTIRLAFSWLVKNSFPEDIWVIVRQVVVVRWQFLPLPWTH